MKLEEKIVWISLAITFIPAVVLSTSLLYRLPTWVLDGPLGMVLWGLLMTSIWFALTVVSGVLIILVLWWLGPARKTISR